MTNEHGRGTFSCRIDGRAGYLRLFDDRLELIRAGKRGPEVLGPEIYPMHQLTRISTGKAGLLLTAVELVVCGAPIGLKFPSADAPRVVDLLDLLAERAAAQVVPPTDYATLAPVAEPVFPPLAQYEAPAYEAPAYEPPAYEAPIAMPELVIPELVVPKVEMPEWTPLPESDGPESDLPGLVLSQLVVEELAPAALPAVEADGPSLESPVESESTVLAAAAALAALEDLIGQIDEVVAEPSSAESAIPAQVTPIVPRPDELSPDLAKRLARLETLRSCGVMDEADYAVFEAEIFELAWAESRSA